MLEVKNPKELFLGIFLSAARPSEDDGIELIYEVIDDMMSSGSFALIDDILSAVDVMKFRTTHLLAFLSITFPAKTLLKERARYFARVRSYFEAVEPNRVDQLLAGLE